MQIPDRARRLALIAALALMSPAALAQSARDGACDRHCLLGFLTEYTEALTDNSIARLAVAATVRVTSNGSVVTLGKGEVWGPGRRLPYRQAFVDPVTGAAVFYGIVTNAVRSARAGARPAGGDAPEHWWFYVARLKIETGRITEIEEISYEPPQGGFGAAPSSLALPDRIFDAWIPPSERSSRDELNAIANKYFDAVSQRIDYHDVPWHPECQRIELGVFTVNSERSPGSCGGEFQTPSVKWNVENRRFYIADVERGLVLAAGNFMTPAEYPNNNGSVVFELFKVQDGLIRQIHAFFRGNGQAKSGWGTGPGS
ncbi:MAG TPA: hypothetical protein VFX89_09135 [Gammaproteobacteria bacterium]|nr:hypothetical protein [Gammaproteobacteria bacterium]